MKMIKDAYREAIKLKEEMTDLLGFEGIDVNVVAKMVFDNDQKKRQKQQIYKRKIKEPSDAELNAVLTYLNTLKEPVEMTPTDITFNIVGKEPTMRQVQSVGNILKYIGYEQYHNGKYRVYKLYPVV